MESKTALSVYTKNNCVQCDATEKTLEKQSLVKGLDYTTIDLEKNPDALAYVKKLGYNQAPVVVYKGDSLDEQGSQEVSWAGFRPDRIKEVAARIALTKVGVHAP